MPIYLLYGSDIYSLNKRVNQLINETLHPEYTSFNYVKTDDYTSVFAELMTVPFGEGNKIVQVSTSVIEEVDTAELKETLINLPQWSNLIITGDKKPDSRKAVIKTLLGVAQSEEFNLVPSWDKIGIRNLITKLITEHKLSVTPFALDYLEKAIGNDTARADSELAKLAVYANGKKLELDEVQNLVSNNSTDYLGLKTMMLRGHPHLAIEQLNKLLDSNEQPLFIVATLISTFRDWLITKAGVEAKFTDVQIAEIAVISNYKRVYYLRNEIQYAKVEKLKQILLILIQTETELKSGIDNLTSRIVEICTL
jgi:DNA polymerase III subunit delta